MNLSRNNTQDNPQSNSEILPWNNPANLIPYDAYLTAVHYYNVVMKPIIVTLGVSANVINCLVFRRQGLRDRMKLCLFALALVDVTYLAYSMAFTAAFWVRVLEPKAGEELYLKTHYYAMGVNYGLREASACISVVVAVERCVCVVFPLRANSLMTTRTMARLLVAIVISMQLAFVTTPIKKYVYPVYDNSTGGTRWAAATAAVWQNSETLILYDKVEDSVMLIVFPLLTFILVTAATVITVVRLRAAMSWREKTSSTTSNTQVQQAALTKMLVFVSSVFIASKVPWVAMTLVRIFYPDFSPSGSQSNIYRVLELAAHYCVYIHSSVNFFIYCSRSSRFKADLLAACCCSRKPAVCSHETSVVSTVTKSETCAIVS